MESLQILQKFRRSGCSDEAQCAAAFKVYLELSEIKSYYRVDHHFSAELNLIYLNGQKSEKSSLELFIPVPSTRKYSLEDLNRYQSTLSTETIVLAMCDPSSTILYYKFSAGIVNKKIVEQQPKDIANQSISEV